MAKKKKKKDDAIENYYDLKTEAVDKLVNAKDAPEVSDSEIRKYRSGAKFVIPNWLKVVFVKFWFAGAVCYFIFWGLMGVATLDLMAASAVALGIITDLMTNNVLRFFAPEKGAFDKWMMFPQKKFWTLFANVLYSAVVMFCVFLAYFAVFYMFVGEVGQNEKVIFGVEPLTFGLAYMAVDLLFVGIKNTFIKIFRDANEKVRGGK